MAKLLVVDDETTIRELLYDAMTRKGYEVTTAASGPQALELMKTDRPDIVLIDMKMPGPSGLETAASIRAFDDALPMILMRGAGDQDVPEAERKRLGIADVLRKELGVELFLSAVEMALKRLQHDKPGKSMKIQAMGLSGTLLVTDDDQQVRRLLQTFFERRGLRVLTASCGEEALKALAQKPDAVMLDMNMPGMDGLMTLKKIKAKAANMPVIMATGVDDEEIVREAMDAGAYDYVTKPFNLEYLETVVLTKVLLGMER